MKIVLEKCGIWSRNTVKQIKNTKHIFLLGMGLGQVIAKEGALKIKELTYSHCQCMQITGVSNHFYNYV